MRTKHFLAALCVPMAFAACSNEEFVNEFPSLESRGTVDVTITAEKPSVWAADTRMSIDGDYKFLWEAGETPDVIGAALINGANATEVDNNVLVNYPFTAMTAGQFTNFSGKSSITEGHYLFYYGYTDVTDRKGLNLGVAPQVYDVTNKDKSALEQAANYMKMISPVVKLEKGVGFEAAKKYNLNLRFANLYSIVKVNLRSANIKSGIVPTVKKVTLDAVEGNSVSFVKTADADLQKIAGLGNATIASTDHIVTPKDGVLPADKMDKALEAINKVIADANNNNSTGKASPIYKGVDVGQIGYGAAEVSVKGDLALSTAEETSLYILVPKGTYDAGLVLTVETSEGNATREITPATGKHLVLDDQVKAIGIDLDFGIDGNVKLPASIPVASSADWAAAVKFVESHSGGYIAKPVEFELKENIEISSFPDFKLEITGTKTLTLAGNHVFNTNNVGRVISSTATLAVKAGATLTLDTDVDDCFAAIENNGTLVVNADQAGVITNLGVMNVTTKDVALSKGLINGRVKTTDVAAVAGTINIAKDKTLTIAAETPILDNVLGEIKVEGTLLNKSTGISANKGTITITKDGQLGGTGATAIANTGTIDNAGVLKNAITNSVTTTKGLFIIQKDSKSDNSAIITGGNVEVKDVATFSTLQGGAAKYKFATAVVSTKTTSKAEFAKANTSTSGITNIILNGGDWTFSTSAYTGAGEDSKTLTTLAAEVTDGITLSNGATLTLVELMGAKITVADGTSTITTKSGSELINTVAELTVNKGATLNVEGLVTMNAASSNSAKATINGNLNVKSGAKAYFTTTTVAEGATLTVFGNKASAADHGTFGAATGTFENNGTVESKAGEFSAGKVAGKVTQPTNKPTGTFKGNADAGTSASA